MNARYPYYSHYALRFPRTYREATGTDCHFEKTDPDRMVGWACALMAAFVAGLLVGGVI